MNDIKTPYLNGHMYEFDLCWLVEKILSFESQLNQAIDLKTIHYADPIQWDITTQYAPNTVVVDGKTGTAYMSKVPVPAGILLTNMDYWTVIFNYQDIYTKIMEGVAFYNGQTDFASKALLVNDLVWYGLDLYRVTRAIEEGGKLIPGTNLVKTSIESLLSNYYGRDRVTTLLNDTLNVSGDYTVNAGDIAETCDNLTVKANSVHLDTTLPIFYKQPDVNGTVITVPINAPDGTTYQIPLYNHDANHINIIGSTAEFTSVTEKGLVSTLGFYTTNDGGGGNYIVTDTDIVPDGHTVFACADGLVAVLLPDYNTTFLTYGGKGDESGQSDLLNSYFKYCVNNNIAAIIPFKCKVGMNSDLFLPDSLQLELNGTLLDLSDVAIYNKDAYSDIRPKYTGNGNIKITGNGIIDARADHFTNHVTTTIRLMHGHDITIDGITLKNFGGYHGIEIISCNNVTISNTIFDGFVSSLEDYESVIQIEVAGGEGGQSGAYPFDNTPNKNVTIRKCTFTGSDNKLINSGIESQSQSPTGDTFFHENIVICDNKFINVKKHCIIPYRWSGSIISDNYSTNTGECFIGILSSNQGFSLSESIVSRNIIYESAMNEKASTSNKYTISLNASSDVTICENIIAGSNTGVLTLLGVCTRCNFNNNDCSYITKLGGNIFYIANPQSTCNIIDNTLSTDIPESSLASLPPNNDEFNGIFLGNTIHGISRLYRDNKLIGNSDTIYTGTSLVTTITPTKLCSDYSSVQIRFTYNNYSWVKTYTLDGDIASTETVILPKDSKNILMISYKIIIGSISGKITLQNMTMNTLTVDGANSVITPEQFTAYISNVTGIKNNHYKTT